MLVIILSWLGVGILLLALATYLGLKYHTPNIPETLEDLNPDKLFLEIKHAYYMRDNKALAKLTTPWMYDYLVNELRETEGRQTINDVGNATSIIEDISTTSVAVSFRGLNILTKETESHIWVFYHTVLDTWVLADQYKV